MASLYISKNSHEILRGKLHFFNTDKKNVKVFANEILYIESLKDYVRVHAKEKKIVTKIQIGDLGKVLDDDRFIRIHKSFVVNSEKVTDFNAIQVKVDGTALPLGRTYKELVEKRLKE